MSYPEGAPLGQETTSRKAGRNRQTHTLISHFTSIPTTAFHSSSSPLRLSPHTTVVLAPNASSLYARPALISLGPSAALCQVVTQDVLDYQQTLTMHLFEFIDGVHDGNYVFQHDNASIHRARATKDFLTDLNIITMDWPAHSPDLNPIENVWGLMARKVYKNGRQYSTVSELKDAVLAAWDEITTDLLIKLSKSMTDRCIAVVRSKGKKLAY